MTRIALAVLAFVAFLPAPALAAPNDFRVVSGTLLHPERLGSDAPVAVLQSDEGTVYYADLRALRGVSTTTRGLLQRGDAVTVFGQPSETEFVVTGIIQRQD